MGRTMNNLLVKQIPAKDAHYFILNCHYAKRLPSISFAYGLFEDDDDLIGICTFGSPASPYLCMGLMGIEHKQKVIELNRLFLVHNRKNEASFFVSKCLSMLPKPRAVVSYSDHAQAHLGVVYQACNFLVTGTTKPRTDMAAKDGKHGRHHLGDKTQRVYRSAKNRYVYMCGDRRDKKIMMGSLKYKILPYPKSI